MIPLFLSYGRAKKAKHKGGKKKGYFEGGEIKSMKWLGGFQSTRARSQ